MSDSHDEAGYAALGAMYRVLCDVSYDLGIEPPERDLVFHVPDLDDRAA